MVIEVSFEFLVVRTGKEGPVSIDWVVSPGFFCFQPILSGPPRRMPAAGKGSPKVVYESFDTFRQLETPRSFLPRAFFIAELPDRFDEGLALRLRGHGTFSFRFRNGGRNGIVVWSESQGDGDDGIPVSRDETLGGLKKPTYRTFPPGADCYAAV